MIYTASDLVMCGVLSALPREKYLKLRTGRGCYSTEGGIIVCAVDIALRCSCLVSRQTQNEMVNKQQASGSCGAHLLLVCSHTINNR